MTLTIVLLLTASIFLSYYQVQHHEFVNYDDWRYVKKFAAEGVTFSNIVKSFTSFDASNWHPLTWLSHMIDVHLFGMNPGAHHSVNVFFHIVNTVLLFFIFFKMTGEPWKSCFAAVLFAIHPLHVESVAWVAERKDVLSTMFWMLTILAYIRYVGKPGFLPYLWVVFFFALGLLSKPMVVTLPFVLLLLDFWPLGRIDSRPQSDAEGPQNNVRRSHLLFEKLPLLVLSAASCFITILAQRAGGAINSLEMLPLKTRLANTAISYVGYIGKMFVPVNLAVYYPYPSFIAFWKILSACIIIIFISLGVIKTLKTQPYLSFGWFWYLGTLVPVIGWVQAGTQSMADRYTYIPLIGLFVMTAWGVPELLKNWKYKKFLLLSLALIVYSLLLPITWLQVRHWADNFSLYRHTIDVTEKNHVAHNNLGGALFKAGRADEAMAHFLQALEIKPDYFEALANLHAALRAGRTIDQAIDSVEKLLTDYPKNSGLCYTSGLLHGQKGAYRQAIEKYQRALSYHPEFAQAQFDLAFIYSLTGDHENALSAYKRTVEIQPDLIWAYYNAAAILALENRVDEATQWLKKAVERGFKDWEYLRHDVKMKTLENTALYQNLLLNRKAKQR